MAINVCLKMNVQWCINCLCILQTQHVMSSLGLKMVNRKINKLFQKHTHFWMFPPATEITRYDWHILKPGGFPCSKNATCCLWEPVRIPLVIASYPRSNHVPHWREPKLLGKIKGSSKGMASHGASGWCDQMLLVGVYTWRFWHRNSMK